MISNPFPCHFEDHSEVWNPLKQCKKHDFDLISDPFWRCSRFSESKKSLPKSRFRIHVRIILKIHPRLGIKWNLIKNRISKQFSYCSHITTARLEGRNISTRYFKRNWICEGCLLSRRSIYRNWSSSSSKENTNTNRKWMSLYIE